MQDHTQLRRCKPNIACTGQLVTVYEGQTAWSRAAPSVPLPLCSPLVPAEQYMTKLQCLQAHIISTAPRTAPARVTPSILLGAHSPRRLLSQSYATAIQLPKQTGWGERGCTPPPGPPALMTDPGSTLRLMNAPGPITSAARSALCILPLICDILCSYWRVCCRSCLHTCALTVLQP